MKKIIFKGVKALTFENNKFKVIVLPELGGKIASFYSKDYNFELLYQNQSDYYKTPEKYSTFADYDTSGFDDCYPNIDKSDVVYGNKLIYYPDHGDIWFGNFDYHWIEGKLKLSYTSELLPYIYEKTLFLDDSGLNLEYQIKNTGKYTIDGFYTVHCLMNCEDDMKIIFPDNVQQVLNVCDSNVLGKKGTIHSYPKTKDLNGTDYYLNKVAGEKANKCEKYYAVESINQGKCGAYYPSIDAYFVLEYDSIKLPYLGLWINESGFKNNYNCALEPSNGFYDSLDTAKTNNKYYSLQPNETFSFTLKMNINKTY
ncbi:DUF5107 domain-containing protein [Clostridium grantii]|uniref:Galactose mutarotase n=1 Tax=Clostridium grantii DSM 8605 TaxID=1121316 RepID=A0A1M5WAP8_9CLOT|nr:DUF5107 domain-containing protein [Clostridium grantii]SHH84556.1 Domain of unknown function [Clostridium grantii DSM 8605]